MKINALFVDDDNKRCEESPIAWAHNNVKNIEVSDKYSHNCAAVPNPGEERHSKITKESSALNPEEARNLESQDEKSAIEENSEKVSHSLDGKISSVITLQIRKNTRIIEKNKTLFNFLIRDEKLRLTLLGTYRNLLTALSVAFFWFVSTVLSLSYFFNTELIPKEIYIPFQLVYTINFILHHSTYIRVDVIKELAKSFNFWFTIWNSISFHICLFILWGATPVYFCIAFHSFSSISFLLFYDAHAGKNHKLMKVAVFNSTIAYIPVISILIFKLVDFKIERMYIPSTDIQIVDVRLQALDNLATMVIYLLRILYTHIIEKKTTTIAFVSEYYEIVNCEKALANNDNSPQYNRTMIARDNKRIKRDAIEEHMDSVIPSSSAGNASLGNTNNKSCPENNIRSEIVERSVIDRVNTDPKKHMVIGVMADDKMEYDLKQTLYHYYIKDRFPKLSTILTSKYYNIFGITVNILATFISLPLSTGIHSGYTFELIGMIIVINGIIYIVVQMVLTTNIFMFRHMIRSFDFWFVMQLVFKIIVTAGLLCEWDSRMVHWLFIAIALTWFIMIDTFHVKYRKSAYISILGILWSFVVSVLSKLNIGDTFQQDRFFEVGGLQILSAKTALLSSTLSACVFFVRFLRTYHKNPNRIFFISENMRIEKIQSES